MKHSEDRERSWVPWGVTCILVSLITTLLGPMETLIVNWNEVALDFWSLTRAVTPLFSVVALTLIVLTGLIRITSKTRATAIITVLAVALSIQHRLFVWDYGVFDGSPIDWTAYLGPAILEVVVWCALFFLALARPAKISHNTTLIVGLVFAFELVGFGSTFIGRSLPPRSEAVTASLDEGAEAERAIENLVTFSSELNVIIVVLDAFQSDFFPQVMTQKGVAAMMPPGFTYYRNAISHYPGTRLSLQSILTSRILKDPTVDPVSWQLRQMQLSVPNLLARAGFRSSLLAMAPSTISCNFETYDYHCYSHPQFIELLEQQRGSSKGWLFGPHPDDVAGILNTTAFRFTPHILKPWLYNEGNWRLPRDLFSGDLLARQDVRLNDHQRRDLVLTQSLTELVKAGSREPTFKFLHFFSSHSPHSIDASCEFNGLRPDKESQGALLAEELRAAVVGQSTCILKRLYSIFSRLDEIGVYDSSMIFVLGDHGSRKVPVDPFLASPPIPESMRRSGGAPRHPIVFSTSRFVPLFLAKAPGRRGPLQISDAPVSLSDVPQSIFSLLGLENQFEGESIFSMGNVRKAIRTTHLRVEDSNDRSKIFEFEVDGHSWYPGSWKVAE